jgi:hypothetical protein
VDATVWLFEREATLYPDHRATAAPWTDGRGDGRAHVAALNIAAGVE